MATTPISRRGVVGFQEGDLPERMITVEGSIRDIDLSHFQAAMEEASQRFVSMGYVTGRCESSAIEVHPLSDRRSTERSKELFLSLLNDRQLAEFKANGGTGVTVLGSGTRLNYFLHTNIEAHNIHQGGYSFCATIGHNLIFTEYPIYDVYAAQLVMLQTDEWAFRSKANRADFIKLTVNHTNACLGHIMGEPS